MISSEESDEDDQEVLNVKPLPWRGEVVMSFFKRLDEKNDTDKSQQAKRQTKKRKQGSESSRPKPDNLPSWALQ